MDDNGLERDKGDGMVREAEVGDSIRGGRGKARVGGGRWWFDIGGEWPNGGKRQLDRLCREV